MRKFFYLIVCLVGLSPFIQAQVSRYDTIPSLIISEARLAGQWYYFYVELANVGDKDINLQGFVLKVENENPRDGLPYARISFPSKVLKPGETYLVAQKQTLSNGYNGDANYNTNFAIWGPRTMPEFLKRADILVEPAKTSMRLGTYQRSLILEYHKGIDSVYVDILHGSATGGPETWVGYVDIYTGQEQYASIAGIPWVWGAQDNGHPERPEYLIVRKTSVKHGNVNWDNSRGTDAVNSEWIVLPVRPNAYVNVNDRYEQYEWSKYFTTMGNHGNGTINSTTITSSVYKIDYSELKITVPWGIDRFRIADNLNLGANLTWLYVNKEGRDETYPGVVTGDKLKVFATGTNKQEVTFELVAGEANDATKATLLGLNNVVKVTYPGFYASVVPDTIYGYGKSGSPLYKANPLPFSFRVDSLLKYTETASGAMREIVWVDGKQRADLKYGDKLKVTNGGATKEYFLAVAKSPVLSNDAVLSAIRWPDIPSSLKNTPDWNGQDIIPGFNNMLSSFVVKLPATTKDVPAILAVPRNLNASISVKPAVSVIGSDDERTTTITVTSQNGNIKLVYKVKFDVQKPSSLVQTVSADPLFTEFVCNVSTYDNFLEISNPGNSPVNLSNYMIVMSGGGTSPANIIAGQLWAREWAVKMYIPGYVFVEGAEWTAKPGFVKPDFQVNSILGAGGSFTVGGRTTREWIDDWNSSDAGANSRSTVNLNPLVDVNFGHPSQNAAMLANREKFRAEKMAIYEAGWSWFSPLPLWRDNDFVSLYKIKNDSITRGLKAVGDPKDFELIDIMGKYDNTKIAPLGVDYDKPTANANGRNYWNWNYLPRTFIRKPGIWKGNPNPGGSWGNKESSEWKEYNIYDMEDAGISTASSVPIGYGLKSHEFMTVTDNSSTVLSKLYKVSEGYKSPQTIKGVITGTKVSAFKTNIIKKNPGQTIDVIGRGDGYALSGTDTLLVTSADKSNTTKYVFTVSNVGLSSDATLVAKTGSGITVEVNGTAGTVSGIVFGVPMDQFLTLLNKPAGATWRVLDANGNLVPVQMPTADGSYEKVKVSETFVIEVTSENSLTVINYQLQFAGTSDNTALLMSSVYPVDQNLSLVTQIQPGISVEVFMSKVMVNNGASAKIYDKVGSERNTGAMASDDMVLVTSPDGKVKRTYFLSFTNEGFGAEAYVTSSVLFVDQVVHTISAVPSNTSVDVFFGLITPAEGASMVLLDAKNNVVTSGIVHGNYKLRVTSGNKQQVVDYLITQVVSVGDFGMDMVKVYPNPTTDKLRIDGLRENCSVVITSISGTVNKIIDINSINNATISVKDLPAGMYLLQVNVKGNKSTPVKFVKQ